jgi:hypothetical protein
VKTFSEYQDYLAVQTKTLLINNEEDLLSFTRFLINYGKVAKQYFPDDIAKLAARHGMYGFKEEELLEPVLQIQFKDQKVYIKTKDKKIHSFDLFSVADVLQGSDSLELLILLSVALDNHAQALFQVVQYSLSRPVKKL